MTAPNLPPIERSVEVSWDAATAFERFVERFDAWWPRRTHSVGGERVTRVVFEPQVGGRIFEEHLDGRRFLWGKVLEVDAPRRVRFSWHPSRPAETAQDVDVRFETTPAGTRVTLVSSGWERWGEGPPKAHRAWRGYALGWRWVLNRWAGVGGAWMAAITALTWILVGLRTLRGGTARTIAASQEEMPKEA